MRLDFLDLCRHLTIMLAQKEHGAAQSESIALRPQNSARPNHFSRAI